MSVQRWKPRKATQRFWSEGMTFDADGAFVTYADHVAALAEAEQAAREDERQQYARKWYNDDDVAQKVAEALREAREAVDGERRSYYADCVNDGRQPDGTTIATFRLSLAAIDALAARQAPEPRIANGYRSPHASGCVNEYKWPPYPGAVCPECSGEAPEPQGKVT